MEQLSFLDQNQLSGLRQMTKTISKMGAPKTPGLCSSYSVSNTSIQSALPTINANIVSGIDKLPSSQNSNLAEFPLDGCTCPSKSTIWSQDRSTRHREIVRNT